MTAAVNFVGASWAPPATGATFTRRSPLDDEDLGPYPDSGRADVDAAAQAAAAAAPGWARTPAPERSARLHRLAGLIDRHADDLAAVLTREEGKKLAEARGETTYAVGMLRYFAQFILAEEGTVLAGNDATALNLARRRALGPVGLITPWNFPLLVPSRKLAPALAFGNTVVLKPSEESPQTILTLLELMDGEDILPPGVLNVVIGRGAEAGAALVEHPAIRAVSFTGSTPVGRRVQLAAAQRDEPIPVQAEMGGKNFLIVAEGADPAFAAQVTLDGVLKGAGQRCTCTGMVLVHRSLHDQVLSSLAESVQALKVGPGTAEDTDVTPLVSRKQLERAQRILETSESAGAQTVASAPGPDGQSGWFLPPRVVTRVGPGVALADEEIFAPIVPVAAFDRDEEAIARANRVPFGLSASIVTDSLARALSFADGIETGVVKVNQETGSSEPQFPFGGWKASASGPHEQGESAAEFYTRLQTVHITRGAGPA